MSKSGKATIAIAVVLAMAISCIVITDEGANAETGVVAEVNGVGYTDLQNAINAADKKTVVLKSNIDCSASQITINVNTTLDLNGYEIKSGNAETNGISVVKGKLVLKDSTDTQCDGTGNGKIYTETEYTGEVTGYGLIRVSSGEFVMQSGYIETVIEENPADKGQFGITLGEGSKATIDGGKIESGWYAISGNGKDKTSENSIIVNGGYLISTMDFSIYHPHSGTLTVNGGVIYGAAGGISINRGDLTINGGTITSKGTGDTGNWGDGTGGDANAAISVTAKYDNVDVIISGGKITAEKNALLIAEGTSNTITISVSGGSFSSCVDEKYVSTGYSCVEIGGMHYVSKPADISSDGSADVDSTNASVSDAGSNVTVNLEKSESSITIESDDGSDLGKIVVSIVKDTKPAVMDADLTFSIDILIENEKKFTATITLSVIVPAGMDAIVKSYTDEGTFDHKVLDISNGKITFETTHNSTYAVTFVESEPVLPPVIDDDDDELPFIPGQNQPSKSDDTTTLVAIAAGAAVVAIIAVLIIGISKGKL